MTSTPEASIPVAGALGPGILAGERFLSDTELSRNAGRAASALHDAGVWQGDTVAILLRNDLPYFEVTRGAGLLGATIVALNWHMTAAEISYILEDCDAKVMVAHCDLLTESVLAVCAGLEVIAVKPPTDIVAAHDLQSEQCRVPGAIPEWSAWLAGYAEWQQPALAPINPMFYTSGTSGLPKGVRRKPVAPEVAQRAAARSARAWGLDQTAVISVMTGPLYHSAPNAYGMSVVRNGGLLVLQPRFDAQELLALIETHRVSHLHMVPTMFNRLLNLDEGTRSKADVSSLKFVTHGAAPCPRDIKQAMIEWWGEVIYEYYAMTETGIIATCDSRQWLAHPGTVGTAVDGVELRIRKEGGLPAETGETGQICVRSETTPFVSYHRAEEKTASLREGDFILTGDVGHIDADGFLYISDRLSDMVISGGVNIYPAEVEKVLLGMPGVTDCAVFGVPDPEFGERLVAVIATEAAPDNASVQRYLAKSLSNYKIPREYHFDLPLPREDSGKIKKRLLRDMLLSDNRPD